MKTKILYIAYQTCASWTIYPNPKQFSNALALIGINIIFHVIQLICCIFLLTNHRITTINGPVYFAFWVISILTMLFVSFVFNRRTLAKSIKIHKNTFLSSKSYLIGLAYVIINFGLTVALFVVQNK